MAYTHAINGGWGYGGIAIAKYGVDGIYNIKLIMICVIMLVLFAVAVLCSKRVHSWLFFCDLYVCIHVNFAGLHSTLHCVYIPAHSSCPVPDIRFPDSQPSV